MPTVRRNEDGRRLTLDIQARVDTVVTSSVSFASQVEVGWVERRPDEQSIPHLERCSGTLTTRSARPTPMRCSA